MRVAVIAGPHVTVPPVKYGGTEQVIYYLIKGLQELGHEPILLGPGDSKVDCEIIPIVDKAISFAPTPDELPMYEKLVRASNKTVIKKLKALLPSVDIIHSHGFDMWPLRTFPNITTIHSPIDFTNLNYFRKRKKLPFVSISRNQQEACPDLNYIDVIFNGEDPKKFPKVMKPKGYLCFLGRFDRDKNPHLAIQLALQLGIPIKIAGKIDYLGTSYFEEEIKKYFDNPLVEYLGELGFQEKVDLLAYAKCNLHPTGFREPFGLTVLEAAYCGTPSLAIARGSMPELIEVGNTGMLVEDFVQGYNQIEKCFTMDRGYIAWRARRLFNYKAMTEKYVSAYQKVIDSYGGDNPNIKQRLIRNLHAIRAKSHIRDRL